LLGFQEILLANAAVGFFGSGLPPRLAQEPK
jgi:hypothetical protein